MGDHTYVCTTIIGSYERLNEQPVAAESGCALVCFTDDPELSSETWEVRVVEPYLPLDLVRSARRVKILLDEYLPGAERTLWIDNTVTLLEQPHALLDAWLESADVAAARHSFRETLLDEFNAVVTAGLDDPSRVYEQLVHYAATDPEVLSERPCWGGLLARRHNARTSALMRLWFDHVLRYSRRDQLSLPYVARRSPATFAARELDNHASVHHRWPEPLDRLPQEARRGFRAAFVPELARVRDLELRIHELEAALAARAEEAGLAPGQEGRTAT